MKIYCSNCAKQLQASYIYCPYCGQEAPKKTIIGKMKPGNIENPIYCPECQSKNIENAVYCSQCGKFLFKKPKAETFFCPTCGEKNRSANKFCINCDYNLKDWFKQQGAVAEKFGYYGDLTLYEKMTEFYYHFIMSDSLSMGRSKNNNIIIPCKLVSSEHCLFNLKKEQLQDLNSTNGTFINRDATKIDKVKFGSIDEFNIAGSFTFMVFKTKNFFIFRLTAILDIEEYKNVSDMRRLDELRNHFYILVTGNDSVDIRKFDGKIFTKPMPNEERYTIEVKNKYYYFSDSSKNIKNNLIMPTNMNLPRNWKIIRD
jgi:predicted RNA-binding Zn-ribbon protein involved in translation (DUF1610 family)